MGSIGMAPGVCDESYTSTRWALVRLHRTLEQKAGSLIGRMMLWFELGRDRHGGKDVRFAPKADIGLPERF